MRQIHIIKIQLDGTEREVSIMHPIAEVLLEVQTRLLEIFALTMMLERTDVKAIVQEALPRVDYKTILWLLDKMVFSNGAKINQMNQATGLPSGSFIDLKRPIFNEEFGSDLMAIYELLGKTLWFTFENFFQALPAKIPAVGAFLKQNIPQLALLTGSSGGSPLPNT